MPNTIEIKVLQEPDGLATSIADKFVTWENARDRWYNNAKETLENLYATSTADIYNQPHDYDNSTHIPKLTQIRDMLITYYLDAMFGLPDYIDWIPYTQEGMKAEMRNSIKSVCKQMLEDSEFQPTIRQIVEDYVDFGNAFATAVPVNLASTHYNGPKAIRINPMDIFFDPLATSFEKSPKIIRTIMTLGELIQSTEDLPSDSGMYRDAINKAVEKRRTIYQYLSQNNRDAIVDDMCHIAGFDSWSTYYNTDTVELLTFYGDLYDIEANKLYRNTRIVIMDRCRVLLNEPITDYGQGCNIFKAGWRDRKDNLWSMSPLDNIKGMQFMIDFLENKRADVFNFISNPTIVTQGDVEMPEYIYPGCHIGLDTDANIQFIRPDSTALQADLYIDRYLAMMEEMAGMPKEAMGFRTPGEKTAFEVSQLNTAASRLFNEKVHKFEKEMLEPLLTLMLRIYISDPTRVIKVRKERKSGAVVFEDIEVASLETEGRFEATGSSTYTERARMAQTLMQIANTALYSDPLVNGWFDPKKIAETLAYTTGLDKVNGILKENARIDAELKQKQAAEFATRVLEEQQVQGVIDAEQGLM